MLLIVPKSFGILVRNFYAESGFFGCASRKALQRCRVSGEYARGGESMRFLQIFHNIKMRSKLIFLFVLTGLIPLLVLSYISLSKSTDAVVNEVFSKNSLFLEVKRGAISEMRHNAEMDWSMLSMTDMVHASLALADEKGADSP